MATTTMKQIIPSIKMKYGSYNNSLVLSKNKIAALVNSKTTEWTALDTLELQYVAYQRVDEGGPAVINARNMLQIYLDDASITPKSNRSRKDSVSGWLLSLSPNPNTGSFTLTTNMPAQSSIKIVDSLGKIVHQSTTKGITNIIEMNQMVDGLYHLIVADTSGKLKTTSFVITK